MHRNVFALVPLTAAAPALGAQYDSAFTGYRPYTEEPVADWRAVNDEVGRIGGHVGIVGGVSAHAAHGQMKPPAQPVGAAPPAQAQPPVRSAPEAPADRAPSLLYSCGPKRSLPAARQRPTRSGDHDG